MRFKFLILLFFYSYNMSAQRNFPKQYTPLSINVNFGAQMPAADLATRFGNNLCLGLGVERIALPSGWILGVDGFYAFGTTVNEDVLAPIRTTDGNIIGDINTYADVELRERAFYAGITGGKLFKFYDNGNKVGGLRFTFGLGFFQHNIRIQDNSNSAQQIVAPYDAGYDRLTNGLALSQFIGYQIVSRDKKVNFTIGFDFTEGFTKNRRGFNFDTRSRDDKSRFDVLYGFRIGWSFPVYTNQNAEDIEY